MGALTSDYRGGDMRRRWIRSAVLAGLTTGMLAFVQGGTAWAHEDRTVGKYELAVGFGDEPAYAGDKNSVQMFLNDAAGEPVVDLGPTLNVEVVYGDQTMPKMTFEPNFEVGEFGTPGEYDAWFIPTTPGDYTFHLTGTINGQKIDEKFTSSPSTFASVQNPQSVEFPQKAPTTGQLAQRMGREFPRIQQAIDAQGASSKSDADSAKRFGIIGLVVGALGLVVGAAALARSRRR
jgi:hypothetical protein